MKDGTVKVNREGSSVILTTVNDGQKLPLLSTDPESGSFKISCITDDLESFL